MLEFTTREFETESGTYAALVITPSEHIRVPASRLDELRAQVEEHSASPVDLRILAEGKRRASEVALTIFRGLDDDGRGSWGFEPGVDEQTAQELAYYLLRDQLFLYRGLFDAGILLSFHVEWPNDELHAYRHALARLRDELNPNADSGVFGRERDDAASVDRWLLRHGVFFFHATLDKLIDEMLPEKWALMERRLARAEQVR